MIATMPKANILVVDDAPDNIMVLDEILRGEYRVRAATSAEWALKTAVENPPDLILLDVMMPGMDGYQVCRRLKENPITHRIPIIFVSAMGEVHNETYGFQMGAVDYIHKPVNPAVVLARVRTHLALYDQKRALEGLVRERTSELHETRLEIIRRLGRAAEYRDNMTGMHVLRISHYSRHMALALKWPEDQVDLIFNASPMHDIGKIGIPDSILLKPDKLNPEEWQVMRRHPQMGAAIIGDHPSALLSMAREIALSHHEKWDGGGYPSGLSGNQIPITSRIVAVADVFDALTTVRPYKPAWPENEAVVYIREQSGKHFDPAVVNVFLEVLPEVLEARARYAETAGQPHFGVPPVVPFPDAQRLGLSVN